MNLRCQGLHQEFYHLRDQARDVYDTGRLDLFIRYDRDTPYFSNIPNGRDLSDSLSLQGAPSRLPRVYINHSQSRTYFRLDRFALPSTEIDGPALDKALDALNRGTEVRLVGDRLEDGRIYLRDRHEYVTAAEMRGDTHLLVNPLDKVRMVSRETERRVVVSHSLFPAIDPYKLAIQRKGPRRFIAELREHAVHPELLEAFTGLIEFSNDSQRAQAHLFLEKLCRLGFCRHNRIMAPHEMTVAVVGFGSETKTIRALLDLGYDVLAVEDFDNPRPTRCRDPITPHGIEEQFADHPRRDRLQVIDWRRLRYDERKADVVLAAAVIDEAFETVARLPRPGGVIAATDLGQVGAKRENFKVDLPDSFIRNAAAMRLSYNELYRDYIQGPSVLLSHFISLRGQTAYILQRTIPEDEV